MSTTLHYGGSFRANGSNTPGLSPAPARHRGRPSQNTSFQAQKRFEMICRMENAALPERAIASMLGISVPRLRYLKKLPEYLIVRMRITHGIILDNDTKLAEIKEHRKEILIQMLPPALQVLANTLMSQPTSYAERKLQVNVAQDLLDRSDIYAKVSRTELKPVSFFDFEKSDKDSNETLRVLKSAGASAPKKNDLQIIEESLVTAKAFQSGSNALSEDQQQQALADLEEQNDELQNPDD